MHSNKIQTKDSQMLSTPLSRRQKMIGLLLTLALHAGAILVLFCMQTDTQKFQQFFQELVKQAAQEQAQLPPEQRAIAQQQSPEEIPQEQEEWGAMKARASRFGAPVIFQEEPEFMIQEPPQESVQNNTEQSPASEQKNRDQQMAEQTQEASTTQAETKASQPTADSSQAESTKSVSEKMALISASSTQLIPVSTEDQETSSKAEQQDAKKAYDHDAQHLHADTNNAEKALPDTITQKENQAIGKTNTTNPDNYFPGWGKKDAAPITKKMVSMANLARGFLDNIKNEGTSAITMIGGKEGGRITSEQLKVERYVQRLNWYLQNSFRINRDRYRKQHPSTTAEVYLSLERNGRIKDVHILRTSGDPLLDDHTLYVFKDAGSSFPPVPHYLTQEPFTITYVVEYSVF